MYCGGWIALEEKTTQSIYWGAWGVAIYNGIQWCDQTDQQSVATNQLPPSLSCTYVGLAIYTQLLQDLVTPRVVAMNGRRGVGSSQLIDLSIYVFSPALLLLSLSHIIIQYGKKTKKNNHVASSRGGHVFKTPPSRHDEQVCCPCFLPLSYTHDACHWLLLVGQSLLAGSSYTPFVPNHDSIPLQQTDLLFGKSEWYIDHHGSA